MRPIKTATLILRRPQFLGSFQPDQDCFDELTVCFMRCAGHASRDCVLYRFHENFMQIRDINIQLSIAVIARNFSRGRALSMDRDCDDRAGGGRRRRLCRRRSLIGARAPVATGSSASLRAPTRFITSCLLQSISANGHYPTYAKPMLQRPKFARRLKTFGFHGHLIHLNR